MNWGLRVGHFVVAAVMLCDSMLLHYWAFTAPSDQFNKEIGAVMGRAAFLVVGAALAVLSGQLAKRGMR